MLVSSVSDAMLSRASLGRSNNVSNDLSVPSTYEVRVLLLVLESHIMTGVEPCNDEML